MFFGTSVLLRRTEAEWHFHFGSSLVVGGFLLWRLLGPDRIELSGEDDGHIFGLPEPIDAESKFNELLGGAKVVGISMSKRAGDLCFDFDNRLTLEVITTSAGYESWSIDVNGEFFAAGASGGVV